MKYFFLLILMIVFLSVASFAQDDDSETGLIERVKKLEKAIPGEFKIDGEVKTGVIWELIENRNGEPIDTSKTGDPVRFGSKDDAGSNDGRFRINAEYTNASGFLGFKTRLNWELFQNEPTLGPHWSYGFGWGSFLNDQLVVSIGKLGASPWGTGGPEMWRELEIARGAGLRFEFKPKFSFLDGHDINIGFVLNGTDGYTDAGGEQDDATLIDILSETVIGASYKNSWFMIRAAYRFDSELDTGERSGGEPIAEGSKLVYRVEEYALARLVPDLSMWAMGYFNGLGTEAPELVFETTNWIIAQYKPTNILAEIRFGIDAKHTRTVFYVRPKFEYTFFNLLTPGIEFGYANDFGEKIWPDSTYSYFEFKPKLQLDFANKNAYVAFEYYYKLENKFGPPGPPEQQTQWFNLRTCIKF